MAHHGQVVRDEQVSQAAAALQVLHDVQHLRLNRHIQSGCGLVADQKFRLGGQCAGDGNTLTLSARKLVWKLVAVGRGQTHRQEQLPHLARQFIGARKQSMFAERFAHDVHHLPAWVQAGIGILKNHLHAPAQLAQLSGLACSVCRFSVEHHRAARGFQQAHQQTRHRALATTRFTDQRQGTAAFNAERHTVYRMHKLARFALDDTVQPRGRNIEGLGQLFDLHQCCHTATFAVLTRQHAARVAVAAINSGRSVRQRSMTKPQRGLKAQPFGMAFKRGIAPSI